MAVFNGSSGYTVNAGTPARDDGETWQSYFNRVAGTNYLDEQGAVNAWAGTQGVDTLGALNIKNGTVGVGRSAVLRNLTGNSQTG